MKSKPSKEDMKKYRHRWAMVNDFEKRELLKTSMSQKLLKLNALFLSVKQLGWESALKAEEEEVRRRWNYLRKVYNG
ncbi:MAG: hypothetical protein ACE5GL_09135 [Calditrichia bacterium]